MVYHFCMLENIVRMMETEQMFPCYHMVATPWFTCFRVLDKMLTTQKRNDHFFEIWVPV